MTRIAKPIETGLLNFVTVVVIAAAMVPGVVSQNYSGTQYNGTQYNDTYPGNLVLNIYIDESGKALVTGYADVIDGLPFLNSSQYKYDKDTKQLYALTNSLTNKSGDEWETKLFSLGTYSEYHSIFYLPTSAKISKIVSSKGLEYLVSASNDSFQVDLHGYDVLGPNITIDYQLPLQESAALGGSNATSLKPIAALMGLALASAALYIWMRRRDTPSSQPDTPLEKSESPPERFIDLAHGASSGLGQASNSSQALEENKSSEPEDYFVSTDDLTVEANLQSARLDVSPSELDDNLTEGDSSLIEADDELFGTDEEIPHKDGFVQSGIKISSEMAAVMETLTAREKAVLTALIENNGKMNQSDIRYETRIPKSSLTGILLSLERRKLIIKKEKGRTNAIELSEWFLSKRDSSQNRTNI